jgi:hypothetical protein
MDAGSGMVVAQTLADQDGDEAQQGTDVNAYRR